MFRITRDPSSGSFLQRLATIRVMVLSCPLVWKRLVVEEANLKTRTEFVPETQYIIFQNIRRNERSSKKSSKQKSSSEGWGGKIISHVTILLMNVRF